MSYSPAGRRTPVEEAYRLCADSYDEIPNPLFSLEQRYLSPLLGSVAGCDVLDLGCGTGRWLEKLDRVHARRLTGVDVSAEMLARAAAKLGNRPRLVLANCTQTPLPDSSSDWIIASFLLSYLSDLRTFAREAARLARTGAVVLLSDVHPATKAYGWKRTFRSAGQTIEIQTHTYRLHELQSAMIAAGFEPMFLHELPFEAEERTIFLEAGRPDLFSNVEGLPVLMIAGYCRGAR